MSDRSSLLVFTDLDGSLLDHHDYSFEPAVPMLERLQERGVPVIPTTSKTRQEIETLRLELGNGDPFIVENGAAIFIPVDYFARQPAGTVRRKEYWIRELSAPREEWLQLIAGLESRFVDEFDYFYRAGAEGIAAMTGLDLAAAEQANCREYSEPVQWLGSDRRKQEFASLLAAAGAHTLPGGRFLTVAGDCNKGKALRWLRDTYRDQLGLERVHELAIGDSGNDVAMLEAAETALLIRSPVHDYPVLQRSDGLIYSTQFGPAGWAEGVSYWLKASGDTQSSL